VALHVGVPKKRRTSRQSKSNKVRKPREKIERLRWVCDLQLQNEVHKEKLNALEGDRSIDRQVKEEAP
jgi:hypothetical protein